MINKDIAGQQFLSDVYDKLTKREQMIIGMANLSSNLKDAHYNYIVEMIDMADKSFKKRKQSEKAKIFKKAVKISKKMSKFFYDNLYPSDFTIAFYNLIACAMKLSFLSNNESLMIANTLKVKNLDESEKDAVEDAFNKDFKTEKQGYYFDEKINKKIVTIDKRASNILARLITKNDPIIHANNLKDVIEIQKNAIKIERNYKFNNYEFVINQLDDIKKHTLAARYTLEFGNLFISKEDIKQLKYITTRFANVVNEMTLELTLLQDKLDNEKYSNLISTAFDTIKEMPKINDVNKYSSFLNSISKKELNYEKNMYI